MHYKITITSDTVCPWCYIGHRRLKVAVEQHLQNHPGDSFEISWHPFQLNPNSPVGQSVDKAAGFEGRFGSEQAKLIRERLRSAGEDAGIDFKFGGCTGNTLDSHRLLEFAKLKQTDGQGLQTRIAEELFADYFERERNITDHMVLANAASRAGIGHDDVLRFLKSDELVKHVQEEALYAREKGTRGVPLFCINETFEVEGAQEPRAFTMLFERLKKIESKI